MILPKLIIRTLAYLVIATIFFLYFINVIQFPKKQFNHTKIETITAKKIIKNSSQEAENQLKIRNDYVKKIICQYRKSSPCPTVIEKETITPSVNYFNRFINQFVFFDYISIKSGNIVIPSIYIITFFTFLLQVTLFSLSYFYQELLTITSKEQLDKVFLYTSEWTVNSPPVLGVIGTIFSLGVLVSNISDISNLAMLIKTNFANAALTTIIGGSVFILNLFINIFTTKNLVADKSPHISVKT